jgi:hypothetical protein
VKTIINNTGVYAQHPLYWKYPRQTRPQRAVVAIDARDGAILADYDPEVGDAVPMDVYHGHVLCWHISPYITAEALDELLATIQPLAERIIAGYESEWDGQNHVARYDADAQRAIDQIEELMVAYEDDDWVCDDDECELLFAEA